ncbi:glycosyltransferase family 2 protein [Streptomyces sp. CA-288835]|uniref:glycosyltransferase family 2 protein n=1 Tax=Streptomyces sp. CA-288835 TaxID=3240069 RepID=UPI003D92B2D6
MGSERSKLVDVVIVNWNTGVYLRDCLRSIAEADCTVLPVGNVVVVDNASSDDSASDLETPGLRVHVVRNAVNRGFAVACNQGARLCESDYLLFLNPDTRLFPDSLRSVGEFLRTETSRGVGICGARMVDERGRPQISCSRFPTLRLFLGQMTGLDRVLPALFHPPHLRPEELSRSGPVDQVIGAFNLMRRSLFRDLGGFDERYFLYFEDVDLALRAHRQGWPSYFLSDVRVFHAGNVSSSQVKGQRLHHWLCSRCEFAFRHMPRWEARLIVVLSLSAELAARLTWAALRRSRSDFKDTAAGYKQFLQWLVQRRATRRTERG